MKVTVKHEDTGVGRRSSAAQGRRAPVAKTETGARGAEPLESPGQGDASPRKFESAEADPGPRRREARKADSEMTAAHGRPLQGGRLGCLGEKS